MSVASLTHGHVPARCPSICNGPLLCQNGEAYRRNLSIILYRSTVWVKI